MPFRGQQRKRIIMISFVCILIILFFATGMVLYSFLQTKETTAQLKAEYEARIQELQNREAAQKTRMVVVVRDLPAGTVLKTEDLRVLDLAADLVSENRITDPKQAVGKVTKIELRANTPLVSSMLFEEGLVPRDLRLQEFNVIQLPTNLQKGQYVDVRINFPTGQDYIVLSKKKVQELSGNIVWYTMDEREILMASSAIIDAYLQGAKLYALAYVDPGMQEAAIPNYPPNPKVLDLMETDPNILETAKTELARQLRTRLDNDLKAMSDVDKMKVVHGSVTVQQQLQNERIVTQQNNASRQTIQPPAEPPAGQENGQARPGNDPAADQPSPVPEASPGETKEMPPENGQEKPPANKLEDVFNQPPSAS